MAQWAHIPSITGISLQSSRQMLRDAMSLLVHRLWNLTGAYQMERRCETVAENLKVWPRLELSGSTNYVVEE
jgi:hypothetical protein